MYKIMFVDDEEQNLFLMEKVVDWEEMGFRVCGIALDGTEGMQVFEETQPDVVFVDIRMEEMDGLTLIENLQKEGKEAIYVIVTAYDEFAYAQKAISLGVRNYLLKPISRKEMIPMMKEIKETLDEAREKKDISQFINRQYETTMFLEIAGRLERSILKQEKMPDMSELDKVIQGRELCSFALFSTAEEPETLINRIESWDIEYKFAMYDSVFCVAKKNRIEEIKQQFNTLKKQTMKQKYILQINAPFTDGESFKVSFAEGFRQRNYCFYTDISCVYYSCDVNELKNREYLYYKEEGEELLRKLIYNASSKETLQLIMEMIRYAEKHKSSPDGLVDQMIELLIFIKSQLTRLYQDRAFMILRHHNVWDLHKIRTSTRLKMRMGEFITETVDAVKDILENNGSHSPVGKATDYILAHFSDTEFSAGEVAEVVRLSRNYFLKIFKEDTGISFWDYVTSMRMEKAKKLLKETDDTIYAISREIGYESQYHFSRKFKNMYGISPNEYRNI